MRVNKLAPATIKNSPDRLHGLEPIPVILNNFAIFYYFFELIFLNYIA